MTTSVADARLALDRARAAAQAAEDAARAAHSALVAVRRYHREGRGSVGAVDAAIADAAAAVARERDLLEAEHRVRAFVAAAEAEDGRIREREERSRLMLGMMRVALAQGATVLVERLQALIDEFDALEDLLVAGIERGDIDLAGIKRPFERLRGSGRYNRGGQRIRITVMGLPDARYEARLFGIRK